MEMELKKRNIEYYDILLDTSALHEETLEIIVPDASPDMLRIIGTSGCAFIKEKAAHEGSLSTNGTIKGVVLYMADGDKLVRRLEVALPFSHTFDKNGITSYSKALVSARLQLLEAREINPRKLAVRANICISAKIYGESSMDMCCDIEGASEYSIQTKKQSVEVYMPISVKEKSFTISDDVEIPEAKPHFASLLKQDVSLMTSDMKIIGSKAIIKGVARVNYCYNTRDGEVASCEHELPYSQIIEVDGMEEDSDLSVHLNLRAAELEPQHDITGDTRYMGVNILVDACAIAHLKNEVDVLSDVYSTAYPIKTSSKTKNCRSFVERISKRVAAAETIELASSAKSILELIVTLEPAKTRSEGDVETAVNEAQIAVMYVGTDDMVYSASRRCSVACPLSASSNANEYEYTAAVSGATCTAGIGSELQVRFFVDYDITQMHTKNINAIADVELFEESPIDSAAAPSVIIKYVYNGLELWDIAKQYNTTINEIAAANGLGDIEYIEAGSMLLIPKKR